MSKSLSTDVGGIHTFQPWFKFGPILIFLLYWLGSACGFVFACIEEYIVWCIPHIEGCTSISRTGRSGTSFYIFKCTLIPVAGLAFIYWLDIARWIRLKTPTHSVLLFLPTILGCLGAIALLLQITFLGSECGICRNIRSYSTSSFFLLTFAAQWLFWIKLRTLNERKWVSRLYFFVCLVLTVELVMFITIPNFLENTSALENSIAWRSSYLIALAPAISAFGWNLTNPDNIRTKKES